MRVLTDAEAARKSQDVHELHFRALTLERADGEAIPATLSTDAAVEVGGELEVLQHTADAVDLSRAPLPLIESHEMRNLPVGVVEDIRIERGRLRGMVRFGNSDRARQILADVRAGVVRSLSVGYGIVKYHMDHGVRIVTRWSPYEVSCVSAPADIGAGFFRSRQHMDTELEERDRCAGIVRASRMFGTENSAHEAIASGESLSAYRQKAVMQAATRPASLGMSRSELRRYSLARALSSLATPPHHREKGFEWEIHAELAKRHRGEHGIAFGVDEHPGLLYIPPDVAAHLAQRDLTAASGGGYLVGTENAASWVDLLGPRNVGRALGVTVLDSLRSNITIAKEGAGTSAAQWLATENSATNETQPAVGQIALTPKTGAVYTEFSRQLLLQSSPSADAFIARILLRRFSELVDAALLSGSGAAGQPLGIVNTAGIGSVSGTSLALAQVLELQTDIGDALGPNCGYVTTRAVAAVLAARQKATGTSTFLWEGSLFDGVLGGYRAMTSSTVATGNLLFGAWDCAVLASWGTLAVEINPFAGFTAGTLGARVLHAVDVGVLRPDAFTLAATVT